MSCLHALLLLRKESALVPPSCQQLGLPLTLDHIIIENSEYQQHRRGASFEGAQMRKNCQMLEVEQRDKRQLSVPDKTQDMNNPGNFGIKEGKKSPCIKSVSIY